MTLRPHNFLPLFLFPFSFFLLQGCSSGPATLTLHPAKGDVSFEKTFSQAYCGKSGDGSYSCVLISDDAPAVAAANGDAPLAPATHPPLLQVVHIKILWRPMNGIRDSVASNAVIDWYVMNNTPQASEDLLLYQGSGYVTLKPDGNETKVTIRSADLKLAQIKGTLNDPIGTANITGSFIAAADRKRVHEWVSSTRQRLAAVASGS